MKIAEREMLRPIPELRNEVVFPIDVEVKSSWEGRMGAFNAEEIEEISKALDDLLPFG